MNLLVTVIVTVYKRTEYLHQAIQSALEQTFSSFEIIVTDDSCSDAIKGIVNSFQRPEIRYRQNPITYGVALNLRAAINEARGKYIAVLNDDDMWEPTFLEKLVAPLEADTNRVLAFSDHWIMSEDGQIDVQRTNNNTIHYGRNLLLKGAVSNLDHIVLEKNGVPLAMAAVFRKDALNLDLLVKEVSGAYDFWISCVFAASGRPGYYIAERLTRYRVHDAMETARKSPDKNENMLFIYKKLIELNFFPEMTSLLIRRHAQALYTVGKDNLLFDHVGTAREHFLKSFMVCKSSKAIVGMIVSYIPKKLRVIYNFTLRVGMKN